jgi:CheY-like chemotaxis protein
MTGTGLAEELLRVRPDIPVILCTGLAEEAVRETAAGLGVDTFLSKPITSRELASTVKRVLSERTKVQGSRLKVKGPKAIILPTSLF